MKKVVAYLRVSTTLQAAEGVSLEAQRSRVLAWCSGQGYPPDACAVHTDAGISGKRSDNRPALAMALAEVCAASGVLVVYSLSRLARSVRDTLAIGERLEAHGADLVSLSESIDTTSATGKMVFRLLAVLAEFERDLLVERTRSAIAHKRARGEALGQVPYGQLVGPDGRTLAPDPEERRTLVMIRRWRAEGRSLRQIAGSLTLIGIPTKNGGATWRHSTVSDLLKREPLDEESDPDPEDEAPAGPRRAGPGDPVAPADPR